MLRDTLVEIGDMGERLSHIRDTLLVLQRAVPFVTEHGDGWLEAAVKARLKMAGSDVQSLNDYEVHLTDKIQFLLDADLGFINTEQNDLFKVMTIGRWPAFRRSSGRHLGHEFPLHAGTEPGTRAIRMALACIAVAPYSAGLVQASRAGGRPRPRNRRLSRSGRRT